MPLATNCTAVAGYKVPKFPVGTVVGVILIAVQGTAVTTILYILLLTQLTASDRRKI